MTPKTMSRRCCCSAKQSNLFALTLLFILTKFQYFQFGCLCFQRFDRSNKFSQQRAAKAVLSANKKTNDDCSSITDDDRSLTLTQRVIRSVLDSLRDSDLILKKHREHVESDSVTHLFKGTPFTAAPAKLKLQFVESWAGRALSEIVREEGIYLKSWKIDCIIEAAGDEFDEMAVRANWGPEVLWANGNDVVVYSFEDCPWCIAAETLLQSLPSVQDGSTKIKIVQLEPLGPIGKQLRAILAKETERTSMPCIFIRGVCIGGHTDGEPCGVGLKPLHENGDLKRMLSEDKRVL